MTVRTKYYKTVTQDTNKRIQMQIHHIVFLLYLKKLDISTLLQ